VYVTVELRLQSEPMARVAEACELRPGGDDGAAADAATAGPAKSTPLNTDAAIKIRFLMGVLSGSSRA